MTNLVPVPTADAVLLQPIDPLVDFLMGRLTRNQYRALFSAAETALAFLSPDDPLLPDGVEGIQIGGRR